MATNRLYVGSRYEPQGRNAGNMFKRTPIFNHITPDKNDNSPFANYKTNQSFSSQFTQEERPNPEGVRCLIREELAKLPSPEENNRKLIHTLQAQITDLKERINQYEKDNNTRMQESALGVKQEVRLEAERMDKEVEQEITAKLRSFFQKVNYELKKDILKTIEDDFLTISYGEDLENRLDDINANIESIHSLINSKQIPSEEIEQKIQQATLAENLEPKLTRIEKEIELNKKHNAELAGKIKSLEEETKEDSKRSERNMQEKMELLKDKVKAIDQELQKKIAVMEIQLSGHEGDGSILKDKISELQKYNEEQRSLFLDFNRKLSNTKSVENEPHQLSTSIVMSNSALSPDRPTQLQPQLEATTEVKPVAKEEVVQVKKAEVVQPKKVVYQFDTENYLMDGEGNYILTQDGNPIKLSEQQIQALFESNAIEVLT